MSFNFKVGGTWRTLASGWVKVGGTWQEVQSAWVKVSGAWQKVYEAYVVTLTNDGVSSLNQGTARIYLRSDGTVDSYKDVGGATQINASTDWIIPNSTSKTDFEAKWDDNGGTDLPNDFTPGWTAGTYADLTGDLYVGANQTGVGSTLCNITITIRRKSDSAILATGDYGISETVTP